MARILKLPEGLIAKIAAGEVIERPFSVVKELVENSLDAGAGHIQVEVEEGGRRRITVIDDGSGMNRDDAILALERHATSKIASEEDLFRIGTLGFRGEALPSIAAVSQMTIETRGTGEEVGVRIEAEGGKIVRTGVSPLPRGTRITVRNLFFNTPARLKFLKSRETEFSHIASWVETIALSRPAVGFSLQHNGKVEIRSNPQTETRLRIRDILGEEIAEFLHPVEGHRGRMEVGGFASDHRATGASAKSLFFFVNGRPVRDRTLQHAVLAAFENLLMKHRTPWVVLYLTVPADQVDVNVHPTKSEVRFANGGLVHDFVREGVRQAVDKASSASLPFSTLVAAYDSSTPRSVSSGCLASGGFLNGLRGEPLRKAEDLSESTFKRSDFAPGSPGPERNRFIMLASSAGFEGRFPSQEVVRIIGQVHGTYLVCETPDKLVLIDQHAAHERIGFEKLKREYEAGGIAKQQLLIPQNFDLRPSQGEVLKKYLEELRRVGLDVEFFGGNTFILRTIPVLLEGTDCVSLIVDLIEALQSFEKLTPLEERIHEVLERIACHRQVRAGDRLTNEEIGALLREMVTTPSAGQCPHGRPAVIEVPFADIEKWFRRRL